MIRIERTYMTHTGGTKFYQPFRITFESPDRKVRSAVTVIHFGPNRSSGAGFDGRPVMGGQVQVTPGGEHYTGQIEAKRRASSKGHYEVADSATNSHSDADAHAEIHRLFGATNAEQIYMALGLTWAGDTPEPSTERETVVSEPTTPTEMPEHWGRW